MLPSMVMGRLISGDEKNNGPAIIMFPISFLLCRMRMVNYFPFCQESLRSAVVMSIPHYRIILSLFTGIMGPNGKYETVIHSLIDRQSLSSKLCQIFDWYSPPCIVGSLGQMTLLVDTRADTSNSGEQWDTGPRARIFMNYLHDHLLSNNNHTFNNSLTESIKFWHDKR